MWWWLLIGNLILSGVWIVWKLLHGENAWMAILFVSLPYLGFLFYFVPVLIRSVLERVGVDREAILTHAHDIDRQPEHPDVQDALNVVPVEDAMAVSANSEKRALLLGQLKKDLRENYRVLLAAERDEDTESAHYVAAAKMEIYRIQQARWLECRRDLEENPDDPETFHTACEVLREMLASDVLSAREQTAYRKRLCHLVQLELDKDADEVRTSEMVGYLDALVELGENAEADQLWKQYADKMRTEDAYRSMLKMFHRMGDRREFAAVLDDLRKNRQVRLSPTGLEQLRYWSGRLAG